MKYSEAILRGYKKNGGRQCAYELHRKDGAMCVQGAANLGGWGDKDPNAYRWFGDDQNARGRFCEAWGLDIINLNNGDGREIIPWEHLYGMAVAAGL